VHGQERVHGLGPWQKGPSFPAAKAPAKDDKPGCAELWGAPHGDVGLARSGPRSP
jgi:hypothetical protein